MYRLNDGMPSKINYHKNMNDLTRFKRLREVQNKSKKKLNLHMPSSEQLHK